MTRASLFSFDGLDNLARRIHAGQVVFFVGAGFSLDSEGLSSFRLVLRLLARFDALSWALARASSLPKSARRKALRLRATLRRTFSLSAAAKAALDGEGWPSEGDRLTTGDDAWALSQDYYRANEWIAGAFGSLLALVDALDGPARAALLEAVHGREDALLRGVQGEGRDRLPPIEVRLLAGHGPDRRGKALFVDTLGFADPEVIAGRPHAPRLEQAQASFAGRLRPRHHILARWAREGLCRSALTTNYDLLLEGAFRLSGLAVRTTDERGATPEQPLMLTDVSHFTRIGEAVEYFRFGASHRSASITKIHGCAERYRQLRNAALDQLRTLEALEDERWVEEARLEDARARLDERRELLATYLPAIVFTFREIQNWREDAWSRDLLANLLRTRSIVFCGYSAQDRVIHDAFRTIYEEMADVHARVQDSTGVLDALEGRRPAQMGEGSHPPLWMPEQFEAADAKRARAFFMGAAGPLEFDALEILRAASRAEGVESPSQTEHPNYLQFYIERPDAGGRLAPEGFPGLDDSLRWLWHRTLRFRQRQTIDVDLRRVVSGLLGHACSERGREGVLRHFEALKAAEERCAREWERAAPDALGFDLVVGWTDRFHVGLLGEFAAGEVLLRRRRGVGGLTPLSATGAKVTGTGAGHSAWTGGRFFPAAEHPQWTVWALVVEIALRRMIAAWRGKLDAWAEPSACVRAASSERAAVTFTRGPVHSPGAPRALAIALAGLSRVEAPSRVRGAFGAQVHHWRLRGASIPWWPARQASPSTALIHALPGTPDAGE
ncbi:SIR2 family protein, partial [Plesiocystis pacifica]|uniref:SIR2 family protein n=1 Tax=Plesiocystis pacifica TaxID=191768 RepID=UPI0018DBDEF9